MFYRQKSITWDQYLWEIKKTLQKIGMIINHNTFYSDAIEMLDKNRNATIALGEILNKLDIKEDERISVISQLFMSYHYYQAGEKRFYVYKDLFDLLSDTDLPNDLTPRDIRLPFESILIDLPVDPTNNRYDKFILYFTNNCFHILGGGDQIDSISDVRFPVTKESIDIPIKKLIYIDEKASIDVKKNIERFNNFLWNILLYINTQGADIEKDESQSDKIQLKLDSTQAGTRRHKIFTEQLRKSKQSSIYLVGKKIKSDEFYQYARIASDEIRKSMKRFRVRGHWTNQVCGPERRERKLIWIMPYWKGPTLAEIINNKYVVKKGKESPCQQVETKELSA